MGQTGRRTDDRGRKPEGGRQEAGGSRQEADVSDPPSSVSGHPSPVTRHPSAGPGWWVVAGALLVGLVFYGLWLRSWLTARPTPAQTFTNPLIQRDAPEPDLLAALNDYWLFTSGPDTNLLVLRSPDMVQWTPVGEGLERPGVWAEPGTVQSPAVIPGPRRGYILYYTARARADGRRCIGLALSEKPAGPYDDSRETPLVCGGQSASDADAFVDEDGTTYLLWREGGTGGEGAIRAQRLNRDALEMVGEPTTLLTVSQPWEGQSIGAPTLVKRAGRYFLLYSGNAPATRDAAIGYAVASSPLGPFTKSAANPLLTATAEVCGPSGQAVFLDAGRQDWLLYQAQPCAASGASGQRSVRLDRLQVEGDTLTVVPASGAQPAPAVGR